MQAVIHTCSSLPGCSHQGRRQRSPQGQQLHRPLRHAQSTTPPRRQMHRCRRRQAPHSVPAAVEAAPATPVSTQEGLVLPLGTEGAWDAVAVGSPVVRCFMGDNEERWFMWYSGRGSGDSSLDAVAPAAGSIGVAVSSNGISWRRGHGGIAGTRGPGKDADVGRVLEPNQDEWWWLDTRHLTVSDVQMFSGSGVSGAGVYWLYYAGSSFEAATAPAGLAGLAGGADVEGLRSRAGLALSQDGKNWARIEGGHHTAAVLDAGEDGDWDAAFVGAPQVVAVSPSERRMYYHSFCAATGRWTVGLATSGDGMSWRKQGPVFSGSPDGGAFDGGGAAACHVVRDGASRKWLMFYEAVAADNRRCISMAVSSDGRGGWRRLGRPILEAGPQGAWDGGGVGAPCPVSMADGRWRVYYHGLSGTGGAAAGIGVAITDKEDLAEFEGVRCAFKRRPCEL